MMGETMGSNGVSDLFMMVSPEGRVCRERVVILWSSLAFLRGTGDSVTLMVEGAMCATLGVEYLPEWIGVSLGWGNRLCDWKVSSRL